MALDTNIVGTNLDAGNNVKVALTNTQAYMGGVRMFSENDAGTVTGTPLLRSPETSQDYRLRTGVDTLLFNDTFNALTQNTNNWAYTFATLTAAQPGAGTVNFSAVQGTTNAHGAFMRTFQYFPVIGTAPLSVLFNAGQYTASLVSNEVWLMGLGLPTAAVTPPTDGVWFQITSAGIIGVLAYNGTITQTGLLLSTSGLTVGQLNTYEIIVGENYVGFWRNDVLLLNFTVPNANGQPFQQSALPAFMMKYNTGAVSNTNTMRVGDVTVALRDIATNKPWAHQAATAGMAGYVGQNGQTQGQTAIWANNTAPTAVAIINTAVGAFAGIGGISAVLPTLTANNDGIVFSYQNPAPTINITGRNLIITGIKVQGAVTVVLAGGPVIYAYTCTFGLTAATNATTETASFATATTHAPRRVFLGIESFAATAPVGTLGAGATLQLTTPIVVRPGEFLQISARNMGTVTTTGAITIGATFDAYWE